MPVERWSAARANKWHEQQPWFVGCNFTPSTAINQLEMWQADTFDEASIERELGWAAELGFNSVRVFLHDLVWQADPQGFKQRIDRFLTIAWSKGVHTMFVIFDDCWFPPTAGKQPEPIAGMHNSAWAQSPGHAVVRDPTQWRRLEAYVKDIISTFGQDERVCVWDLYNEPGNVFLPLATQATYQALPRALAGCVRHLLLRSPSLGLLRNTFKWARECNPSQPLTAPLWVPNTSLNSFQLAASDVVSFHQYADAEKLDTRIAKLQQTHNRPVMCTEFLSRSLHSKFETHLPVFHDKKVAAYCWGLVSGKTQTIHHWNDKPGSPEPDIWHHDVLRADGSPYAKTEALAIKKWTSKALKP